MRDASKTRTEGCTKYPVCNENTQDHCTRQLRHDRKDYEQRLWTADISVFESAEMTDYKEPSTRQEISRKRGSERVNIRNKRCVRTKSATTIQIVVNSLIIHVLTGARLEVERIITHFCLSSSPSLFQRNSWSSRVEQSGSYSPLDVHFSNTFHAWKDSNNVSIFLFMHTIPGPSVRWYLLPDFDEKWVWKATATSFLSTKKYFTVLSRHLLFIKLTFYRDILKSLFSFFFTGCISNNEGKTEDRFRRKESFTLLEENNFSCESDLRSSAEKYS